MSKKSTLKPGPVKKPHRELLEINQDYVNACAQRGDIRFKIDCLEADENAAKQKILNIRQEYVQAEAFYNAVNAAKEESDDQDEGQKGDDSGVQPDPEPAGEQGHPSASASDGLNPG